MTPQAEQLVLQYLSRVADAAYGNVPARRRARYLADLRSRIDRACGAAGAQTSGDVRRVLRGFGRPEELAAHELAAGASGPARSARPPDEPDERHAPEIADDSTEPEDAVHPPVSGGSEAETSPDADQAAAGDARAAAGDERARAVSAPANRPVRLPPPWRSDPSERAAARPRGHTGAEPAEPSRVGVLTRIPGALRRNPAEALALALYLAAAAVGTLAAVWLIGAAIVVLSRVWTGVDKAAGVGVPVLATLVGMALWESGVDHIYVDQIIWKSLAATGVDGLRLAALGAAAFLALRLPQGRA